MQVQASKLADGLRTAAATVLQGLTAKFGAVTVSGLRTVEQACSLCAADPCHHTLRCPACCILHASSAGLRLPTARVSPEVGCFTAYPAALMLFWPSQVVLSGSAAPLPSSPTPAAVVAVPAAATPTPAPPPPPIQQATHQPTPQPTAQAAPSPPAAPASTMPPPPLQAASPTPMSAPTGIPLLCAEMMRGCMPCCTPYHILRL